MHDDGPMQERPRRRAWEVLRGDGSSPSLARRFLLSYGVLLAMATMAIGLWVGQQVEDGVLNRTAAVTAVYIHSFVAPEVQSLATRGQLDPADAAALGRVLTGTELGQRIVGFRVWSRDGTVVYSPSSELVGRRFALAGDRARSFEGEVTVDMSNLFDPENVVERQRYTRLIEMYVPILKSGSGQVLAVAEFYQLPNEIDAEVWSARLRSWALVLLVAIASYVIVAAMVLRTSRTIRRQESRLRDQVDELTGLLAQVADLNTRIRHAGADAVAIYAQERRRISADLHDGPGQALALALLQFEDVEGAAASGTATGSSAAASAPVANGKLRAAHAAISDALRELRQIAAGLRLPELAQLSVTDVIERAVDDHARRTGISAAVDLRQLPTDAPLSVKIGLFRALQETLSNATRHGRGIGVAVRAWSDGSILHLEVSDRGPGFDVAEPLSGEGLGLPGIRERATLIGGTFEIRSMPGKGTVVRLAWPLAEPESDGGGAIGEVSAA